MIMSYYIKFKSKQYLINLLPLSFVLGTPVITAPKMEGNNLRILS